MDLRIRRLDPGDPHDLEASYAVRAAADAQDLPDDPPWSWSGHVGRLVHPWPAYENSVWLADVGADTVGVLELQLPQQENRHRAFLAMYRAAGPPAPWRRPRPARVGRRLRPPRRPAAADRRRTSPGCPEELPAIRPSPRSPTPSGRRRPGRRCAAASTWPPWTRRDWDSLLSSARPKTDGYSVVHWIGATPEELLEDVAALESRIISDAPAGDLEIEPEAVDAARMRASDETMHQRGRRVFHAGARDDASGRLVAWTVLTFDADTPSHAWQLTTIVDPGHRGHRLGLLVEDRQSQPDPGPRARVPHRRHLERGGERPHDRHQRGDGIPPGRRLDGLAAGRIASRPSPAARRRRSHDARHDGVMTQATTLATMGRRPTRTSRRIGRPSTAPCQAIAERTYWSAYPESPSPKVYGETRRRRRQGRVRRATSASTFPLRAARHRRAEVATRVEPYGIDLGVALPAPRRRRAARRRHRRHPGAGATPARDAGSASALEILHRINGRIFELAHAVHAHDRPGLRDGVPGRRAARAGPRPRGGRLRVRRDDPARRATADLGEAAGQGRRRCG